MPILSLPPSFICFLILVGKEQIFLGPLPFGKPKRTSRLKDEYQRWTWCEAPWLSYISHGWCSALCLHA